MRRILILLALLFGLIQIWAGRYQIGPDLVPYLEIAHLYAGGHWQEAVNAQWSPLYPWLIGTLFYLIRPLPQNEIWMVQGVHFASYLFSLLCFEFFLSSWMTCQREWNQRLSKEGRRTLPEWAWIFLGYTLFFWSNLYLISANTWTPDMLLSAFIYLSSGFLLNILRTGSWQSYVLLGGSLGFAYLTKAVMSPLSLIFLGMGLFGPAGDFKRTFSKTLLGVAVFLLVSAPHMILISKKYGGFSFGENGGTLNYAWFVSAQGTPLHFPRKIIEDPPVYLTEVPFFTASPFSHDLAYWLEWMHPSFDGRKQWKIIVSNFRDYLRIFRWQDDWFLGFLILFLLGYRKDFFRQNLSWGAGLMIPAMAGLAIYLPFFVASRYLAPFVFLFWAGLFSLIHLPHSDDSRKIIACVMSGLMILFVFKQGYALVHTITNQRFNQRGFDHEWRVAQGLRQKGIGEMDKIIYFGSSLREGFWIYLAKAEIIAESPFQKTRSYWEMSPAKRLEIENHLAGLGAKAIVAQEIPDNRPLPPGWERIPGTFRSVRMLPSSLKK